MNKTFITVDPASFSLGLCLIANNKLGKSYSVQSNNPSIAIRCGEIADEIKGLELPRLDAIYIEILNKMTHRKTLWSIGAILAGLAKFSDENTSVIDNQLVDKKGTCIMTPSRWQKRFGVIYTGGKKQKDTAILDAFAQHFPTRKCKSQDEAVAVFFAQIILEEGIYAK